VKSRPARLADLARLGDRDGRADHLPAVGDEPHVAVVSDRGEQQQRRETLASSTRRREPGGCGARRPSRARATIRGRTPDCGFGPIRAPRIWRSAGSTAYTGCSRRGTPGDWRRCRALEGIRMYNGRKVVVVMPAYNAARTIRATYDEVMPAGRRRSRRARRRCERRRDGGDRALAGAREGGRAPENRGYGANQKTCYREALAAGADIVIMVHPDYQYTPKLIPAMAAMIGSGLYTACSARASSAGTPCDNGMPWWKYVANRALTLFSNVLMHARSSRSTTRATARSRGSCSSAAARANSDDFVFDNQVLAQILWLGHTIAEVSCPTKYFAEASSIGFRRSVRTASGAWPRRRYRLAEDGAGAVALFPRDAGL
jgi:hypothetical protein